MHAKGAVASSPGRGGSVTETVLQTGTSSLSCFVRTDVVVVDFSGGSASEIHHRETSLGIAYRLGDSEQGR